MTPTNWFTRNRIIGVLAIIIIANTACSGDSEQKTVLPGQSESVGTPEPTVSSEELNQMITEWSEEFPYENFAHGIQYLSQTVRIVILNDGWSENMITNICYGIKNYSAFANDAEAGLQEIRDAIGSPEDEFGSDMLEDLWKVLEDSTEWFKAEAPAYIWDAPRTPYSECLKIISK